MISLQTPYFIVLSDGAGFVVRVQRTSLGYPDLPTMERDMESVFVALDRLGRERKGICVDLREGPMRNDGPFEEAIRRLLPRFLRGYRGVAVVVRTAVGALQVKRHLREANIAGEVFQDETEAMDHLRTAAGVMSRRPTPVPPAERLAQTNSRDKLPTSQLQAVERVPPTSRGDRPSSLPPMPSERPNSQVAGREGRDRMSTVPPAPGERISQLPGEDRPSSLPIPPLARPPRTN